MALVRIGEATKHFKPKQKAILLQALRQSGFNKDDLRERGWTFSTHLWSWAEKSPQFPSLHLMGKKRSKHHVMTEETTFSTRRRSRSESALLDLFTDDVLYLFSAG